MRTLPILFLAMACSSTTLPGSDSEEPAEIQASLDNPFSLEVGQEARLQNQDLSFEWVGVVTDSRCPEGVTCVWAGEVTVEVRWLEPVKPETDLLTLGPRDSPSWVRLGNTVLELIEVHPYPGSKESQQSSRSRAVFQFSRSSSSER